MEPRHVQFSSVVVGDAHNPTILNPNFLECEGIVPKAWGWTVDETVTTPPLAMVRYANGVNITVEHGKLQITDPHVENGPAASKISEVAASYISILRHVRYTAVGNNFQSLIPIPNPAGFLRDRFLKEGGWSSSPSDMGAIELKVSYPIEPTGRLILSVGAGEAKLEDNNDPEEVIVCNANFSRKCEGSVSWEEAIGYLTCFQNDWESYNIALSSLFESELESAS